MTGVASCKTARIPKDIQKAKEVVNVKTREIEAIVNYHNLASPFLVRDTIVVGVPSISRTLEFPVNISRDVTLAYERNVDKFVPDSVKNEVRLGFTKEVMAAPIFHSYSDSLVDIRVSGNLNNIKIDYKVKERTVSAPIEYEKYNIDIKVRWYENTKFLRNILAILICIIIIMVLIQVIRWKGLPIRLPFP